jgi:nucleoside-triphosphatase THEP1
LAAPTFPGAATVKGRLLAALLSGAHITSNDALRAFSTSRCASLVEQLRRAGFPIQTEMIDVATADGDRRARVGRYSVPVEAIEAAGNAGRQFVEAVEAARRH